MTVSTQGGVFFQDTDADSFFMNILREDFQPGVIDALNNENFLWNFLGRADLQFYGRHWVFAVHTGRSQGHSAIGKGGKLPSPGRQGYDQWRGPMRQHYGRIQFDDWTPDATNERASFMAEMITSEVVGLIEDMTRQQNRMLHNDGSGRLAQVDGAKTSLKVVNVKLPQIPEDPDTMTGMDPTYFLQAGMRIAFVDSADDTVEHITTIDTVDSATQITVIDAFSGSGVGDNNFIVSCSHLDATGNDPATTVVDSAYKREPMGLAGMFSDANPLAYDGEDEFDSGFAANSFQNVDAANTSNGFARANILDGSGTNRPLTEGLMQTALTRHRKVNRAKADIMISSHELRDAFGSHLLADRRFMNTMTLSGGWTAVDYAGIPWMVDRDCYPNRLYIADLDSICLGELTPYEWQERTGMFQQMQDYDEFHARFRGRWNTVTKVRNRLTLLTDLSESIVGA